LEDPTFLQEEDLFAGEGRNSSHGAPRPCWVSLAVQSYKSSWILSWC
jgi:hypothetical protein